MQPPHRRHFAPLLLLASFAVVAVCASAAELLAAYRIALGSSDFLTRLSEASGLSPLNWSYAYRRGAALRKLGRYEEAREMYERGLEQNPACSMCAMGIAEIEQASGLDAEEWIERAVASGRSSTRVRMGAGILYARSAKHEQAAAEFAAALMGNRASRTDLFDLFRRVYPPDFVLSKIIPDAL